MKVSVKFAVLFAITVSAAGCEQKISSSLPDQSTDASQQALLGAPSGNVVAMVNGEVISEPLLKVFAGGKGLDVNVPEQRQRALNELEENLLLAQEAINTGIAARPEVQAEVTLARLLQLSGRMISQYRATTVVAESEVRAYYDQEVERAGHLQYHLQHILFADAQAAQEAVDKAIAPGADFDALMGEYAAKGAQSNDLGWVTRTQVPDAIAQSAANLTDGQVAPVVIKSTFGWHVLKRVAARPFLPPSYESVRDGAEKQLKSRALGDQVKSLRSKASIQAPEAAATPATVPAE